MSENKQVISNQCNFASVKPAMMELPYPELQVTGQNLKYANLLTMDYCGGVSEMTAITQYINHESRMSGQRCALAKVILGIAMAEMIHLQKLAELIWSLGGSVDFVARQQNGQQRMWTPSSVKTSDNIEKMIQQDIEGERGAIQQYKMHMQMIQDIHVNRVLHRIIQDEEYHIMLLQAVVKMC